MATASRATGTMVITAIFGVVIEEPALVLLTGVPGEVAPAVDDGFGDVAPDPPTAGPLEDTGVDEDSWTTGTLDARKHALLVLGSVVTALARFPQFTEPNRVQYFCQMIRVLAVRATAAAGGVAGVR